MFRIIKFKSVKTLNFITWKEKDHINPGGNTKIKPSHTFQCSWCWDKNFKQVWDWQSAIFENACVQCEQWHFLHCTCSVYDS